jgi:hypothetical protein
MELTIYLAINACLYLLFGAWCALSPEYTSSAVGLLIPTQQGYTEYIAVYGGLEFGVGVFFLLALLKSHLRVPGLVFGACFYCGLALFRTFAIAKVGTDIGAALNFYIAEVSFAAWSLRLVMKSGNTSLPL